MLVGIKCGLTSPALELKSEMHTSVSPSFFNTQVMYFYNTYVR